MKQNGKNPNARLTVGAGPLGSAPLLEQAEPVMGPVEAGESVTEAVVRPGMRVGADGLVLRDNGCVAQRPDLVRDEDGLTERQRAFVDQAIEAAMRGERVDMGSIWQSVSGCEEGSRSVGAALAMGRPEVRGYLRRSMQSALEALSPVALAALVRLLQRSRSEYVVVEVAKLLMGLVGYRAGDSVRVEDKGGVEININIAPPGGETAGDPCTIRATIGGGDASR